MIMLLLDNEVSCGQASDVNQVPDFKVTEPGSFAIRLGLVWLERDATVTD